MEYHNNTRNLLIYTHFMNRISFESPLASIVLEIKMTLGLIRNSVKIMCTRNYVLVELSLYFIISLETKRSSLNYYYLECFLSGV